MDRRRSTSLVVAAVAALASIATSPMPRTPPPTADTTTTGTVEVSGEHPAAVRELVVRVTGLDPNKTGQVPTVQFTTTANTAPGFDEAGGVRTSIVLPEPGGSIHEDVGPSAAFRVLLDPLTPPRNLKLTCTNGVCEGRFALVVDVLHRTGSTAVNVDWQVATHVDLWGGVPAGGKAVVDVTVEEPATEGGAAAVASAYATGDATRLDIRHRLTMWRLSLTLGDGVLAEQPGWPLVVLAHLRPTNKVVTAPNDAAGDPWPGMFVEGVGDQTSHGVTLGPRDELEFEPFYLCLAGETCAAEFTVGLQLDDARPDVAIDAGWELDVQAIATDGRAVPVTVVAEPIPPMPMISATLLGRFVTGSDGSTGPAGYTVIERSGVVGRDRQWDGLRTPTYGIFRATTTSTGSVPMPPDERFVVSFAPDDQFMPLTFGEEVVYGFTAGGAGCARVPDCDLSEKFSSGISSSQGSLKPGWQVTVDWELELGMGTSAIGGDSQLTIEAAAQLTPPPGASSP
jgi:hypothetical protein